MYGHIFTLLVMCASNDLIPFASWCLCSSLTSCYCLYLKLAINIVLDLVGVHRAATTFYYTCTGLLGFTNLKGQACINTFAELSCDCRGTATNEEKKRV